MGYIIWKQMAVIKINVFLTIFLFQMKRGNLRSGSVYLNLLH
jgi:hypothetical protein